MKLFYLAFIAISVLMGSFNVFGENVIFYDSADKKLCVHNENGIDRCTAALTQAFPTNSPAKNVIFYDSTNKKLCVHDEDDIVRCSATLTRNQ